MKRFLSTKKFWFALVAVLVVGWLWHSNSSDSLIPAGVETGVVLRGEVKEVVSETGFVKAANSVDLSFERGGYVQEVKVEAGDRVEEGQVLIGLRSAQQTADLSAAYARLQAEQARLAELTAGADANSLAVTQSSVDSAETALDAAKKNLEETIAQQNQLVANAEKTLRSTSLQAYLVEGERENSDYSYTAPTITGTYDSEAEGLYRIELYGSNALSGSSYRVSGLESATEAISTVNPTPLGTKGLYIQFPSNFAKRTEWEIPIPNTRSATYLTNLNAYNSVLEARNLAVSTAENAVAAAQAALAQVESQLNQVSSSARDERIEAQKLLVNQMQFAVTSARIAYDNTFIVAPFTGVVTRVETEVGQTVSPSAPIVSLISSNNYELMVDISEVDISEVSINDPAIVTFDAYDDIEFKAHIIKISPNATLVDGVRVFEVTLVFDEENEKIKDGLSADIEISTAVREGVIAVPTRAIYEDENGKFVRVVSDTEQISAVNVVTGLRGSDGKSEILSGLNGGETIITFASEEAIKQIENN
ncbi:efflux RND transporter periplasmic adaptor subunit [Candidatus Nomurabacteria bacterium]|nr:efflux RND transporter periplasmic adaptor subunit [Candidatus Kaiserbacteria bacterium]MCB9814188.1 efflux RND transporter periplasmic adaptor subunit [Candidatus Nomurabacteria bacterium]